MKYPALAQEFENLKEMTPHGDVLLSYAEPRLHSGPVLSNRSIR